VAAANQAFAKHGDLAQMDDIARAAGVGVGTVYRHFPTKDALVGELLRQKFEQTIELVRAQHEVEDPWEAFAGLIRANTERMAKDQAQQRMMWSATDEAFAVAEPVLAELRAEGAKLIRRAHRAGVLRRDFTVANMPTLMCSLGSAMQVGHLGEIRHDWRKLLEILLDGLRAR
jgi:AcrR family transcriptional regulator